LKKRKGEKENADEGKREEKDRLKQKAIREVGTILLGTPPNDSLIGIIKQKPNGNDSKVILDIDGLPAEVALMDLLALTAHDLRDGGTTDVDI